LYYTALYGEAKTINGKGESMELYRQTLKGSWQFIDGKKAYVFTEGCFLGLQVLGDDVEPCFEGAGFFSHQTEQEEEESILAILEKYEKKLNLFQIPEQGGNIMNINFKLSDGQKHEILFHLLNPKFNEEGGWSVEYMICEVYDEYALVYKYEEQIYERVYYTKDDVEDKIEITSKERAYIIDVNLEEKKALDDLKGEKTYIQVVETIAEKEETISLLQGQVTTAEELIQSLTDENQTYTNKIAEVENTVNTLTEEIHNYGTTIGELENNISTLTTERDEAQTNFQTASQQLEDVNSELGQTRENFNALQVSYDELSTNYANIETERNELANFKNEVIRDQKLAVISNYTETLDAEIIQKYTNGMEEYSVEDLDMRLTYECKKANPTIFSKNNTTEPQPAYVPKEEGAGHGINDILARYEKK
jgi:phage shock protein A